MRGGAATCTVNGAHTSAEGRERESLHLVRVHVCVRVDKVSMLLAQCV